MGKREPSLSQQTRRLVGKTITEFKLRGSGRSHTGEPVYDPLIVLSDGTRIVFRVQEHEGDGYGVCPNIIPKDSPHA